MERATIKLIAGSCLLVAGAALLAGPSLYRNDFVQRAASIVDLADRTCRKASVAKGSACPTGCAPRPARQPSDRYAVPECRSRLWVETCRTACAPDEGFVRLSDGRLAAANHLEVELSEDSDAQAFIRAADGLGARADSSLSGLYRYRLTFENPESDRRVIERLKAAIEKKAGVARVAYETK